MANSFSVTAMLSAKDNGFSSTLKSALGSVNALGDRIKSGFAFGALMGAGQAAFSTISNGVKSLFSEAMETSDAMYKLQAAMRFSGTSEDEIERIAGSTGSLKTYADKTVFSLQDVMSTFGALSANGVKDADKLTEYVGNAVAVFGGGANEYSSVALAFSQSMAAGKMAAQDWNQVLNASPQLAGGLKKELQKLNPALAKDFKGAMEDGAITADLLGQAMTNIGMTKAAEEAATSVTTWEGAIGNLEATVSGGLMTLYDSFAKSGLINVVNSFSDKIGGAFDWLSENIPKAINKIKPYWDAFKESFSGVGTAIWDAVKAVGSAIQDLFASMGDGNSVNGFKSTMTSIADAIKSLAGFVKDNASTIAQLIKWLPKIAIGMKALKIAKAVAPGVVSFSKGIASLAGKGISGIAAKLFGISKAEKKVGEASATSGKQMLMSAGAFALMGVAVLAISVGFALLVQSAIALADAGWGAIGVMAGLVIAVVGLGIGMAFLLKSLSTAGPQTLMGAAAMAVLGAAVVLVALGFALLVQSAIALSNAGWGAIGALVGLIVVIAALGVVVALLGPALLVGAVGFLALGAGLLLCGVAAVLAATALVIISTTLPMLAQYGLQGALAILTIGAALAVFAIGAALAGVACLALGAGLLVVGAAVLVIAAGFLVLSAAILICAVSLALISVVLPLIATYGTQAAVAFLAMGAALVVFGIGAALACVPLLVLSATFLAASVGILLCAAGIAVLAAGILIIGTMALVAAASFLIMAALLPLLTANALGNSIAMGILAAGLVVLGAGAVVAGAGFVVLGAGLVVAAVGIALVGAAIAVLGAGILVLSIGAIVAAGAIALLSLALPLLGSDSAQAALGLVVLGAALAVFAVGAALAGAATLILGAGMIVCAVGVLVLSAALFAVSTEMRTIAKNAKSAEKSLNSMQKSVNVVESGLKAIGSVAKSAIKSLTSAFDNSASKVKAAGKKLGDGFTQGMQSGLAKAPSIALQATMIVAASLKAGQILAFSAGSFVSVGFANGMLSQLAIIRSAANQMVAAADKAIRAKAKIASPSKLFYGEGNYCGMGFVNALEDSEKAAYRAAAGLINIPAVAVPEFAGGYNGELSTDYNYSNRAEYVIEVPLNVDGREFARATADHTQAELNRKQLREDRKYGKV